MADRRRSQQELGTVKRMDNVERRHVAVMMADVVGFTTMMALDEDGTLAALRAHRAAIDPLIANHGGRIVKTTGDGLLVEFPGAEAAVRSGLAMHSAMDARNEALPASRRMTLRIGINLADVIVDESNDIFGDGVNVAARLESIADPGGISVSESVRDRLVGTIDFEDAGFQQLKGVPGMMRVWKTRSADVPGKSDLGSLPRSLATIAVLPFENLGGDSEQEYFADGIAEDLIGALSHDRELALLSRSSTFAYKGRNLDVRLIARELDATHVVTGSVRKASDRLRLTAQLIDGESGATNWSEKYDRMEADVFELQDELVETITTRVAPSVRHAVGRRRSSRPQLDAWDLTIRGQYELNSYTRNGLERSIGLFAQARELDPTFATPVAHSAGARLALALMFGVRGDGATPFETARREAELAMKLDENDFFARLATSMVSTMHGAPEAGAHHAQWLIDRNPLAPIPHNMLGLALISMGRADEAIEAQTRAWQLGVHEPMRFDVANDLAYSHFAMDALDAAVSWAGQGLRLRDHLQTHYVAAATLGLLGRAEEASRSVMRILELIPTFSAGRLAKRLVYPDDRTRQRFVEGLLLAGLPE